MRDQRIAFETAMSAKFRGFMSGSNHYYDGKILIDNDGATYINGLAKGLTEAPTQSMLQKWLREERKIHVQPMYNKNGKYSVTIVDDCDNSMGDIFGEFFNTYESALEAGLLESFNLMPL